jgi:valyl-tRNA synthetase
MVELSKAYEPQAVEAKWYARWLADGYFRADANSAKRSFSIVMPPPNITGVLTVGHVLNTTIQDILARRARMQGHEVLWLPGTDHAGVATQTAVEKYLKKTEKKTRHDLGREEFLRRVLAWQEKHGGIIIEQLKRLGVSADWSRQRYTFDPAYSRAVERVFVRLFRRGIIYRNDRIINWDPAAQTALSDEEVIAKPQKGRLYYVRYEIVEEPRRFIEVATTRPETIMADTGVAVHPGDKRYLDLVGKHAWRPLAREKIPIIADEAIDPEFGTGVLKVTPGHDKVDFEIGARHKLPIIDVLTANGLIDCPAVPELHGLDRFEARKKAAEMLQESNLLSKTESYENNVGFSDRSEVPIEPRLSRQWFLDYPKAKEALAVVRDHLIRFFPAHWEKVYTQWLENIQEWCISRQVWWGHRIPVWRPPHSANEGWIDVTIPEVELRNLQPTTDLQKSEAFGVSLSGSEGHKTFFQVYGEMRPGWRVRPSDHYAATTSPIEARELERRGWVQDPDTLDTWFSSWLWAYETMDEATRKKFYPTSVLVTAPEIIFFWVARMIIAGLEFAPGKSGRPEDNIPFRDVYFTGLIRDGQGRKMSKSLGNSPDPVDLIDRYGADGLRFGLMRIAPSGQDIRFDEKQIEEGRNFANKLWNAARFRMMQGPSLKRVSSLDLYPLSIYSIEVLNRLEETITALDYHYANYEFNLVVQTLYHFFWNDYCDWFLEAAKEDVVGYDSAERKSALAVMDCVFSHFLRMLHPFMPHITEELWATFGFEGDSFGLNGGQRSSIVFASAVENSIDVNWREALAQGSGQVNVARLIYDAVRSARNLRSSYRIPSNRKVPFVLRPIGDWVEEDIRIMRRLIGASELLVKKGFEPAPGTPMVLIPHGELYLPLEGLIDVDAERQRLGKEIAKTETELVTVRKKLANQNFVANAPPVVVAEHRQRENDFAERLTQLQRMLRSLG